MYAEDVSGSGRRKINQGFLMLVALDAREQPFQLLAVAAADAEERTLHLYQIHVPYHHACLTTTLATIQEQALQDAALVRRKLRALTRTLTRRRSLRRSEAGRGRWCGGGATLTGVSKA